jgi:cytoskeletal protein RodZ
LKLKLAKCHSQLSSILLSSLLLCALLAISVIAQPASARHHVRRASQLHSREEATPQESMQEEQSAPKESTEESAKSTNGSGNDTNGTTTTTTDSTAASEEQSQPETGYSSLLRRGHLQGSDTANTKALGNIMFNCAEIFLLLFIFSSLSGGGLLGGLFICAIVWHFGKMFRGGRKPAIG